jgi:peptide/nickel transport system substrate-binding protein
VQPRRWATLPDVGCGSYRVAERTDGEIRFESRAGSHGEAAFDEIVLRPYASTVRLVGAMHRGEVDAIELTDPSFARELHTSNPDVFVSNVRSDFMHPWFFAFNGRRYPFSDPRMRTLLVKAVDRKVIADESFDGLVSVPDGPFDVSLPEHGSRTIDWPYDPSSVVVTLGSWGYYDADGDGVVERGGTPLRFTLLYEAGSSTAETMARALKLSFQSVGVEIIPTGERLVDVWSRMLSGDYDLVLMQLSLPPTADVAYRLFHSAGPNPFGLGSHSVDRAVEALFSSSDRVGAFSRFHVAVAETRQIVFLAQPWRSFVAYSADRTQEVATLLTHYPELVGR